MANTRTIKRRIKSAKNTSQITKAMQMVAASKMRKATEKALAGKPYASKIHAMTTSFAQSVDQKLHPLLNRSVKGGVPLIVLISTNKGLCGGLNTVLLRSVSEWFSDTAIHFVTIGRKGKVYAIRSGRLLDADFSEDQNDFISTVSPVARMITDGFLKGTYSSVTLVYNEFISALKQKPVRQTLLPIVSLGSESYESAATKYTQNIAVEPSMEAILDTLLFHYIENQIRTAVLESEASEHSARMIAMKNATDNARELTDALTLDYNKLRQQKITSEILDIVTARVAVE